MLTTSGLYISLSVWHTSQAAHALLTLSIQLGTKDGHIHSERERHTHTHKRSIMSVLSVMVDHLTQMRVII